jgi:hypothetical protein
MSAKDIVGAVFGGVIALLPFGLIFGLVPPLFMALSNRWTGSQWLIPSSRNRYDAQVPCFELGIMGGIGGAFVAFVTLMSALEWECYSRHIGCNDGQGGIELIFTLPILSVVCSTLALVWTSLSFRIPEESVWASLYRYSGQRHLMNWVCAIAIQAIYWVLVSAVVFRGTLATF